MIWGSQWDVVMRWMYNSGDEEKKTYTYDSTEKGNYSGSLIATGSNEAYAVNNIYDMDGNAYDWTMEIYSNDYRVMRGASDRSRTYLPPTSYYNYGSRVALYM